MKTLLLNEALFRIDLNQVEIVKIFLLSRTVPTALLDTVLANKILCSMKSKTSILTKRQKISETIMTFIISLVGAVDVLSIHTQFDSDSPTVEELRLRQEQ